MLHLVTKLRKMKQPGNELINVIRTSKHDILIYDILNLDFRLKIKLNSWLSSDGQKWLILEYSLYNTPSSSVKIILT